MILALQIHNPFQDRRLASFALLCFNLIWFALICFDLICFDLIAWPANWPIPKRTGGSPFFEDTLCRVWFKWSLPQMMEGPPMYMMEHGEEAALNQAA